MNFKVKSESNGCLNKLQSADSSELVFAVLNHELNSYLQIIFGNAEFLRLNSDEDSLEVKAADAIIEAARRASYLSQTLQKFNPENEPDLGYVCIHETLRNFSEIAQYGMKGIRTDLRLAAKRTTIVGNSLKLQAAFLALAMNAKDAMPTGGALTVETETVETECFSKGVASNSRVVITISDSGTGISPENIYRIFDPYFTTKEPGKGTGLGLADVYRIISLHKGSITVSSAPSLGTTFKISLPCAECEFFEPGNRINNSAIANS